MHEDPVEYYREKGKLKEYLASVYGYQIYNSKWKWTDKGYEEVKDSRLIDS